MRDAIKELAGIGRVEYDAARDLFRVDYDPAETGVAAIFGAVFHAGKKMGQEYLPRVAT